MGLVNFLSRLIGRHPVTERPDGVKVQRLSDQVSGWAQPLKRTTPLLDQVTWKLPFAFEFPAGARPKVEFAGFGFEGKNHDIPSNQEQLVQHWAESFRWGQKDGRLVARATYESYHPGHTPVFRITPPGGQPMLVEVLNDGKLRALPLDTKFTRPPPPIVDAMDAPVRAGGLVDLHG